LGDSLDSEENSDKDLTLVWTSLVIATADKKGNARSEDVGNVIASEDPCAGQKSGKKPEERKISNCQQTKIGGCFWGERRLEGEDNWGGWKN